MPRGNNGQFNNKVLIPWNKGKTKFPKLKCKYCKKEFQSYKENQKYCSRQCSLANRTGENNHFFKGGKTLDGKGYRRIIISILSPEEQGLAKQTAQKINNNWILEHRLVMAKKIGRPLNKNEIIHHIDGNKLNNHPDNLELLIFDNRNARYPRICPKCGHQF